MTQRLFFFLLGLFLGIWLGRSTVPETTRHDIREMPVPRPQAPAAPVRDRDSLTEIKGIGPAFEEALNALGIYTFAQLARQNPDTLAEKLGRVTAERIRREGWIDQAGSRAGGRGASS
jgi:predicted flap endonuclease-1-like 5' DNA nuclease